MTFLVCAGNRQQKTRSENTLRRMEHSSGWNYSSIVIKLELRAAFPKTVKHPALARQ
jgi:hypothetical protein